MRLFLGLVVWIGGPLYTIESLMSGTFNVGATVLMLVLGVGLAFGEYSRYTARQRRNAAGKAQQDFWLRKGR